MKSNLNMLSLILLNGQLIDLKLSNKTFMQTRELSRDMWNDRYHQMKTINRAPEEFHSIEQLYAKQRKGEFLTVAEKNRLTHYANCQRKSRQSQKKRK